MASLQYYLPCSATTTTTTITSFPKPSHFITHAKRGHLLKVSCQNQTDNDNEGNTLIDRRNMLLGLGGLYSATNLISSPGQAAADSVKAPDFDRCHIANYRSKTGEKRFVQCCLNASTEITDYELPKVPPKKMRERLPAHKVTDEYIFKYNTAIDRMKRLPKEDPRSFTQQANIHCAYCNDAYQDPNNKNKNLQVHFSSLFFPFHRWYIYFFERICGELIDDPTFALPFWNWDVLEGMTIPPMFLNPKSTLYDPRRDPMNTYDPKKTYDPNNKCDPNNKMQLPLRPLIDLSYPKGSGYTKREDVVNNNLYIMQNEMICANEHAYDFMGKPYGTVLANNSGAVSGAVERGCHTAVHVWVGEKNLEGAGEDMGNFYSAGRDPLFYSLHANVDRLWTLWQDGLGLPEDKDKIKDRRFHEKPDFLYTEFLFYDEKAQLRRVRVEDCLDNKKMGYKYEDVDIKPWVNFLRPSQLEGAKKRSAIDAKEVVWPLILTVDNDEPQKFVTIKVPKKLGKNYDVLLVNDIKVTDPSKFVKFDVYVNDEDTKITNVCRASYAGSFAQLPGSTTSTSSISLSLSDLYEQVKLGENDDHILVTLVPKDDSPGTVKIGGLKVIEGEKK